MPWKNKVCHRDRENLEMKKMIQITTMNWTFPTALPFLVFSVPWVTQ
jgi:hypothetical protein